MKAQRITTKVLDNVLKPQPPKKLSKNERLKADIDAKTKVRNLKRKKKYGAKKTEWLEKFLKSLFTVRNTG